MAGTRDFQMRITGQIRYRDRLFRVLHDLELRRVMAENRIPEDELPYRPNLPEVHPLFDNHHSEFNRGHQLLSKAMNPRISNQKWRVVYWWRLWITNHQGFDKPEDPRVDFVNMRDIGAPRPRVECLTTGGSVLMGKVEGNDLVVKVLNVHDPVPTPEWMYNNPWFLTWAVTVDSHTKPRPFPQGLQPNGEVVPIAHPFIGNARQYPRITIPLWKVKEWRHSYMPDPFTFYNPI